MMTSPSASVGKWEEVAEEVEEAAATILARAGPPSLRMELAKEVTALIASFKVVGQR